MHEEEIKKFLNSKKMLIGRNEVLKGIKKKLVSKVFFASNSPERLLSDLERYKSVEPFELLDTKLPNDELGTICKKPFSVSIIGILK